MSKDASELLKKALRLPVEERAVLARSILASLDLATDAFIESMRGSLAKRGMSSNPKRNADREFLRGPATKKRVLWAILMVVGALISPAVIRGLASRNQQQVSLNAASQAAAKSKQSANPPRVPPPRYRLFKFETDNEATYVVPGNTNDEELKSLLWLFREKVRAGKFKDIGITKPTAKHWGGLDYKSGMLVIYRGEKCANEGWISLKAAESGKLPCGRGDHDDAYYQWGIPNPTKDRNGFFDEGGIAKNGDIIVVFEDKGNQ